MKAGMNMKKVLIVDDEFLIRFTLEEGLKDRGYETQSAETVKDALEKMKTFHPQVILLDKPPAGQPRDRRDIHVPFRR